MSSILEELTELIVQIISVPVGKDEIGIDTRLMDDLAMESINLASLMFLCEDHFEIDVQSNTEVIPDLESVGDIVNFISELKSDNKVTP